MAAKIWARISSCLQDYNLNAEEEEEEVTLYYPSGVYYSFIP
jgi:hypothetical protein